MWIVTEVLGLEMYVELVKIGIVRLTNTSMELMSFIMVSVWQII
jgi:hypothetical protein